VQPSDYVSFLREQLLQKEPPLPLQNAARQQCYGANGEKKMWHFLWAVYPTVFTSTFARNEVTFALPGEQFIASITPLLRAS
jgi:hypothetical protein